MKKLGEIKLWGVVPALSWTVVFFLVPLAIMLVYSFWSLVDYKIEPTWTLDNYRYFFTKSFYYSALWNSLLITLWSAVISILVAFPLAYAIAFKIPKRFQLISLIAMIIPFWTSYIVRSYSWLTILSENGIINQFLMSLGLTSVSLDIVYTKPAIILGFVHFFIMLLTLTIYASLVQINRSYFRAAEDLGANRFKTLFYITLPLSLPGIMIGTFIAIILAFGDFITPAILGGNVELVLPLSLVFEIQHRINFPQAAAIGIIMMVIMGMTFLAFYRYVRVSEL